MTRRANNHTESNEEYGDKLVLPPDFQSPQRKCTDVFCGMLIVSSWLVMTAIGYHALKEGDYRVVLYPLDYDGNICGTDYGSVDMTDHPFLYYINSYGGGVCVENCPTLTNATKDGLTDIRSMITYGGYWQAEGAELNASFVQVGNYTTAEDALYCTKSLCFPQNNPTLSWQAPGVAEGFGYAYYVADTFTLFQRCYVTNEASDRMRELVKANSTIPFIEAGYDFWNDLYADIWTARDYVLGIGFGLSICLSFTYVLLLRLPVLLNFLVWFSIFVTIGTVFAGGYFAFRQADTWENEEPQIKHDDTITALRVLSYILVVLGIIMVMFLICLRKQIQLAIGCVKQASRAMLRMPGIIVIPILQGAGFIVFLTIFCVYAVFLASLGEVVVQEIPLFGTFEVAVRTYQFDNFIGGSAWFLLFNLYWTGNFIVAFGELCVAMSFAKWYFERRKRRINSFTAWNSICQVFFYHLGTCAFGALVLAIVQIIRSILARVQKQVKKANNAVADVLLCCCQCCLWCFEKCVRFLSKNAYIQTAIFATPFFTAARESFFLILRNAGRIGAISYVSGAVLVVGRLFISICTTVLAFYLIAEHIGHDLYGITGQVIFVFIISYFVADMFMSIFDMGISTILQCFIADEEMMGPEDCFAEGGLQRWIDRHGSPHKNRISSDIARR